MKLNRNHIFGLVLTVVVCLLAVHQLLVVEEKAEPMIKEIVKVSKKDDVPSMPVIPKADNITIPVRPKYQQLVSVPKKAYQPKEISPEKRENLKNISPRISALWKNKKGQAASYREKNVAINRLGVNLLKEEREAIYDYFRSGPSNDVYDLAVIDRLMNHLDNIPSIAPEYLGEMTNLVKDKTVKGSVRGYAMQHLGDIYNTRPTLRKKLLNVYYEGLKDSSSDVSGTSVMVLTYLSSHYENIDKKLLKEATVELVNNEDTWLASKISTISAAGRLGLKESLPEVRHQVTEGNGIVMKLSAIHSLGQLGNEEDITTLEEIIGDPNKKVFAIAAKKALRSIKLRF
jgi:hypothetical protein